MHVLPICGEALLYLWLLDCSVSVSGETGVNTVCTTAYDYTTAHSDGTLAHTTCTSIPYPSGHSRPLPSIPPSPGFPLEIPISTGSGAGSPPALFTPLFPFTTLTTRRLSSQDGAPQPATPHCPVLSPPGDHPEETPRVGPRIQQGVQF